MFFQEVNECRQYIVFPIDVLESGAVVYAQFMPFLFQADVESADTQFQLGGNVCGLRLERATSISGSTIMSAWNGQSVYMKGVGQSPHPFAQVCRIFVCAALAGCRQAGR